MTAERYAKIEGWFLSRPRALWWLRALNRWLPLVLYVAYPILILCLALWLDVRVWKVVYIPAAVFVAVTVVRKLVNAKRPYETLGITPLISKDKPGESFPSRHVASAFVIAEAFGYINLPLGVAVGVVALLIAVLRPLAGVHFPRDVIFGALFSLLLGLPAFIFLP